MFWNVGLAKVAGRMNNEYHERREWTKEYAGIGRGAESNGPSYPVDDSQGTPERRKVCAGHPGAPGYSPGESLPASFHLEVAEDY